MPTVVLYDPRTVAGDAGAAVRAVTGRGAAVVVLTPSLGTGEPAALLRAGATAIVFKRTPLATLLTLRCQRDLQRGRIESPCPSAASLPCALTRDCGRA